MSKHYPNSAAAGFDWFKSSYSSGDQNCLEVAKVPGVIPVRDSKHPQGPALALSLGAWSEFVERVKNGDYDI